MSLIRPNFDTTNEILQTIKNASSGVAEVVSI